MKSFASLAALSVVSAQNITLTVESTNPKFSNNGLSNIHFGAALNGVILTNQTVEYKYNATSKTVYEPITINAGKEVVPFTVAELGHDLIVGASGEPAIFDNGYLTFNGSNSLFYACKTLAWDPYRYTSNPTTYGVGVYNGQAPEGCEPIKIRGVLKGDDSSKAVSPSSNGIGSGNGTNTTSTFFGYNNGTTTTVQSTQYTTIDCSTPTTLTYGSQTFTVTESTQITVEDCSCTKTPSAAATSSAPETPAPGTTATQAPASETPASQTPASVSPATQVPASSNTTAPGVGIANGANPVKVGSAVAGLALVALLV